MSQQLGPFDEDENDDEFLSDKFVDNGGFLHETQQEMIEANLDFEGAWGTGAGCGQDPDNVADANSEDE